MSCNNRITKRSGRRCRVAETCWLMRSPVLAAERAVTATCYYSTTASAFILDVDMDSHTEIFGGVHGRAAGIRQRGETSRSGRSARRPGADLSESWISNAYMQSNFGNFAGFHHYPTGAPPATGAYNFDGESYWNVSGWRPADSASRFPARAGPQPRLAHPHDTEWHAAAAGVTSASDLGTLSYNQNITPSCRTIPDQHDVRFAQLRPRSTPMAFESQPFNSSTARYELSHRHRHLFSAGPEWRRRNLAMHLDAGAPTRSV